MFLAIRNLLSKKSAAKRVSAKKCPHNRTFRLGMESLEGRDLCATLMPLATPKAAAAPQVQVAAPTAAASNVLGNSVASYLNSQLGKRVGGGECAHIATMGLQKAGGDFTNTFVGTNTQDYNWGTTVARLTTGSQLAGKTFQVGDIIQYQDAKFSSGGAAKLAHHTQVVAAVDTTGKITKVFEQNVNGNRTVMLSNAMDLSKLTGGSVSIYRAVARANPAGLIEYTIVNNTAATQTVQTQIGTFRGNATLTAANTAGSFQSGWMNFSGSVAPKLAIGSQSISLVHGGAYELYTMAGGVTGIRKI